MRDAIPDFPDALVALGPLDRRVRGTARPTAQHRGSTRAPFSTRRALTYIGGILEMSNAQLYPWLAVSPGPSGPEKEPHEEIMDIGGTGLMVRRSWPASSEADHEAVAASPAPASTRSPARASPRRSRALAVVFDFSNSPSLGDEAVMGFFTGLRCRSSLAPRRDPSVAPRLRPVRSSAPTLAEATTSDRSSHRRSDRESSMPFSIVHATFFEFATPSREATTSSRCG